jgi:hypothetical protein
MRRLESCWGHSVITVLVITVLVITVLVTTVPLSARIIEVGHRGLR